jgi:hypothetical protein
MDGIFKNWFKILSELSEKENKKDLILVVLLYHKVYLHFYHQLLESKHKLIKLNQKIKNLLFKKCQLGQDKNLLNCLNLLKNKCL